MDFEYLQNLSALIGAIVSVGGAVYAWFAGRSKATSDEIDALDKRVRATERRLDQHDGTMKNLPTMESLHDLQMTTERMNSDVRVMGETLKGVKETSNLLRDWLVKESTK